jgi:hypothetical protein
VEKQNKDGTPVSREARAISDLEEQLGIKVFFEPYNKPNK